MKKLSEYLKLTGILGVILFSLYSCSNDLKIVMPQGPAGASAYDVWVQAVKDGTIAWDVNRTDITNYFLYLKGQDGANGSSGQSAYDLWVQQVTSADGIDNPQAPGQKWPKTNTSIQDFWNFLTGAKGQDGAPPTIGANGDWFIGGTDTGIPAKGQDGAPGQDGSVVTIGANGNWFIDGTDTGVKAFGQDGAPGQNGQNGQDGAAGQSAYDLWVQEVLTGTLDDPHNPGQKWPATSTTTQDFWDFLRGADGQPGETVQPGGDTGQPGEDIKIVPGKPNVIAQYVNQNYNEFVRWEDGAVGYIVYNDAGEFAAGAIVKGLPGMDPTKTYTADADGFFLVPKEDLPDYADVSLRRGATTSVTYTNSLGTLVTEASAPNTYVPNRMHVRIILQSDPVIDGTYMRFSPLVERQTDGKDWSMIPSYLGNLSQHIIAYQLTNAADPASYDPTLGTFTTAETTINISSHTNTLRVNRLRKAASYYTPADEWDGNNHWFTLVLSSYYGETPHIAAIIQMAPVQAMPLIMNVTASGYNSNGFFNPITGYMDIAGAGMDYHLFFKNTLQKMNTTTVGGVAYTYYYPEVEDASTVDNAKQFTVRFNITGSNANNNASRASIVDPTFSITPPFINSSVILECTTSYFYPLNTIGYLRFGTDGDLGTLTIVKRTAAPDGWRYMFADMPVTYIP